MLCYWNKRKQSFCMKNIHLVAVSSFKYIIFMRLEAVVEMLTTMLKGKYNLKTVYKCVLQSSDIWSEKGTSRDFLRYEYLYDCYAIIYLSPSQVFSVNNLYSHIMSPLTHRMKQRLLNTCIYHTFATFFTTILHLRVRVVITDE